MNIVEMKFGSHLYGTSTPTSDLDIKAVHLPEARDILLQRCKPVISSQTKVGSGKNSADDVDSESYSLQKFMQLIAEGQTVALDMLFAPESAFLSEPHAIWREIQANKNRLFSRKYSSFVDYCRTQANKYGIRGSRVASARVALNLLSFHLKKRPNSSSVKLGVLSVEINDAISTHEHMSIIDQTLENGTVIRHWEVCGRKMPYTASIKSAHDIMAKLIAESGQRALQAETNNGVDWKALSHAVRIGEQAIELLTTGNVTFPRPNAEYLLDIKLGKLTYDHVAQEIEFLLDDIEKASARSLLRDEPDKEWIDGLVLISHGRRIEDTFVGFYD